MYAHNEIGTSEPSGQIAKLLASKRYQRTARNINTPLYFHTDACHAAPYLDLHINRLRVDLLTINGGKMYAPNQSAPLFIKSGTKVHPQILRGGQQRVS